jgi:hypothetical protein
MQQAALRDYATALQQANAYDCRFYVHAYRPGDPSLDFRSFSALPDANHYDRSICSSIASGLSGSGSPGRDFIRDKVLRERGQIPPERERSASAFYSLSWPSS